MRFTINFAPVAKTEGALLMYTARVTAMVVGQDDEGEEVLVAERDWTERADSAVMARRMVLEHATRWLENFV